MADVVRVRNRRGELVDAPAFTATDAKHNFGRLLDAAVRTGPVAITKQGRPTAVLISIDEYRALTHAEDRTLDALAAEFDRHFEAMQGPAAAAAMQRAFDTSEAQLREYASASLRKPAAKAAAVPRPTTPRISPQRPKPAAAKRRAAKRGR